MNERRCQHDRRNPRLAPLAALRSTHDLVTEAIARVQQLHARRFDPELTERFRLRQKGRRGHPGRVPIRVQSLYSQRAEAQGVLLARLLDGCNVRTNECGRHDQRGRVEERWAVETLVRDTGLSSDRVERAISDLCAGGLLFRLQGREKVGGEWIGFVALTKLTRQLWEVIGLGGRRDRLLAKERETERKADRRDDRKAAQLAAPAPPPSPLPPPEYFALTWELANAHPEWSDDQVRAEALARAGPAPPATPDPPSS